MAEATDASSTETLTELYEKAAEFYNEIDSSDLASNSDEYQNLVERCRCRLEHLTLLVSRAGVFSNNEGIDELPVSSIKFLCIPGMLGQLTLKRKCVPFSQHLQSSTTTERNGHGNGYSDADAPQQLPERQTVLRLAKVYFRDFISRCIEYGITKDELPKDDNDEEMIKPTSITRGGRPTPQELHAMGCEREKKVSRFREKMSLQNKVKALQQILDTADEETRRKYYLTSVKHSILTSFDELASISQESSMLKQMEARQQTPNVAPKRACNSNAFKPLLITRDEVQKAVYGMGYPSLPIFSVEEFYEKRVREGWFPPGRSIGSSSVVAEHDSAVAAAVPTDESDPRPDDEQNSDDEESEVNRAKLIERDEYRDMHRRGWGNTYNRS